MSKCGMCEMLQSPPNGQIIYETSKACAIIKYGKRSRKMPIEFLIVPKQHFTNLHDTGAEMAFVYMAIVLKHLSQHSSSSYQIRCNNGRNAGQTLFHLHWHIQSSDTCW